MKIIINAVIENEGDEFIATHHNKDGDLLTQIVLDNNTSQTVIDINDGDTLTVQDVVEVSGSEDLELTQKNESEELKEDTEDNTPHPHVDSTTMEG